MVMGFVRFYLDTPRGVSTRFTVISYVSGDLKSFR